MGNSAFQLNGAGLRIDPAVSATIEAGRASGAGYAAFGNAIGGALLGIGARREKAEEEAKRQQEADKALKAETERQYQLAVANGMPEGQATASDLSGLAAYNDAAALRRANELHELDVQGRQAEGEERAARAARQASFVRGLDSMGQRGAVAGHSLGNGEQVDAGAARAMQNPVVQNFLQMRALGLEPSFETFEREMSRYNTSASGDAGLFGAGDMGVPRTIQGIEGRAFVPTSRNSGEIVSTAVQSQDYKPQSDLGRMLADAQELERQGDTNRAAILRQAVAQAAAGKPRELDPLVSAQITQLYREGKVAEADRMLRALTGGLPAGNAASVPTTGGGGEVPKPVEQAPMDGAGWWKAYDAMTPAEQLKVLQEMRRRFGGANGGSAK